MDVLSSQLPKIVKVILWPIMVTSQQFLYQTVLLVLLTISYQVTTTPRPARSEASHPATVLPNQLPLINARAQDAPLDSIRLPRTSVLPTQLVSTNVPSITLLEMLVLYVNLASTLIPMVFVQQLLLPSLTVLSMPMPLLASNASKTLSLLSISQATDPLVLPVTLPTVLSGLLLEISVIIVSLDMFSVLTN